MKPSNCAFPNSELRRRHRAFFEQFDAFLDNYLHGSSKPAIAESPVQAPLAATLKGLSVKARK